MSSAKRTPRYVDVIRPFEVAEGGRSAEVIRLRPERLLPKLPPITKAWPRVKAVPVARRPWQLLLVPPAPDAPTRSFHVARWQARMMMVVASAVLVVAGAGVTAFVVAIRSPEFFDTRAEAALLRSRLIVVEDSLALARAALEDPDDSLIVGPTLATASVAAEPATTVAAVAAVVARSNARIAPRAARASSRRVAVTASPDDESASIRGGAFEGLPVIGAIASRFSRARWHPMLHITRPHLGVDVAARRGTKIIAPAGGRVSFVGRKFGFGLVLEIEHSNGVTTRYAHCGSALVAEGARVERGTAIATVGTSGLSTGPHLHYEVLVHGHQVDPLRFRIPQMADSSTATAPNATPHAAATPAAASTAPGTTLIVTPNAIAGPVARSAPVPVAAPHPSAPTGATPK
ncbi:MAG: peptidase family [Gemmatimonadetes bacterium]|nr:peptidase family [Gemmatimonadota bacterium]